jgi:hypothetical protein
VGKSKHVASCLCKDFEILELCISETMQDARSFPGQSGKERGAADEGSESKDHLHSQDEV